jgi:hypothetical protein
LPYKSAFLDGLELQKKDLGLPAEVFFISIQHSRLR